MTFKKIISLTFLSLLFTSFLFSQSVAELAKKEKERREKLKKKKSVVITNAGLKKTKKQSAVTTSRPATTTTKAKSPSTAQPKSTAGTTSELDKTGIVASKDQLEQKWNTAKEYVDLLTTKLNGLWQEYYSMDDMTDRSSIQRQIAETFQKLEKAKVDAAKAKKELDQSSTRVIKNKSD